MLTHSNATLNGGAAIISPLRVASIAIRDTTFDTIAKSGQVAVLFRILKRPIIQAEQRARAHLGKDIPAALMKIDVTFPSQKRADKSILGPLTTGHPALVRSLKVLMIAHNDYDESGAALDAFAALATHLQALTFRDCGLTSVQGLEGRCEYLRTVDLRFCKHLTDIGALVDHVYLEEVDASYTRIPSIATLRSCPNLTTVYLDGCRQLSSIDALADRQRLKEVAASHTRITSIEPLRSCPNLTKVVLYGCDQLSSMDAFADHQRLQKVNAAATAITSIEPLRSCPKLTEVHVFGCEQLPVDVRLPPSVKVFQQW